jgi:hypothetical protein
MIGSETGRGSRLQAHHIASSPERQRVRAKEATNKLMFVMYPVVAEMIQTSTRLIFNILVRAI